MNIVTNLWYNWSIYEKAQQGALLLGITLLSLAVIYLISRDRRILLLSLIGFSVSTLLSVLGILLVNTLFEIEITEVFKLIPILTFILLLSNLGVLTGFFVHKKSKKNFKVEDVRTEYFMDTSKQTIFLLLLGSSVFLFVSIQTQGILVTSILSCLGGVWSIYWISKYILK